MNFAVKLERQIVACPGTLRLGVSVTPDTTTITAFDFDSNFNVNECAGTTVPTNGEAGYKKGAFFTKTNQADGTSANYENVGSATACQFKLVGTGSPGDISLPHNQVLVGNAAGLAAAVAQSGDVIISDTGVFTIQNGAVTAAKLTLTVTFAGNALAGHTHTVTPTGTVAAPTFTGNALGTHQHNLAAANETQGASTLRLYIFAASGTFTVGETITGGTSAKTATVAENNSVHTTYLVVTAPSGEFTALETITGGTSAKTATVAGTLTDHWDVSASFGADSIISCCSTNTKAALAQQTTNNELSASQFRYRPGDLGIETKHSDGWTSITANGLAEAITAVSAGTPSGTNSAPAFTGAPDTTSSDSAGTPSGTNTLS